MNTFIFFFLKLLRIQLSTLKFHLSNVVQLVKYKALHLQLAHYNFQF